MYNVESYLCNALDSVINQTYQNLEIIVVDDGSTDRSGFICDQYKELDSRISVVHQQNRGLSGARNTGLDKMHGDVVAFLDPDDEYMPQIIERLVERMVCNNADIAVCSFYVYYSTNGKRSSTYDSIYPLENGCVSAKKALNLLLDDKLSIGVWCKIYKETMFKDLRFPDGYVFEDQVITPLLIEKADRIVLVEEPLLSHWRNRPGSITATLSEKNILDSIHALKVKEEFVLTHTPSVYDFAKANCVRNQVFCSIIGQYASLLFSAEKVSDEAQSVFQNEIQNRAKRLNQYNLKTKAFYYLFTISPRLFYLTKRGLSFAKKRMDCLKHMVSRKHG